jgi:prepilin-type processing-associated H-X9-DG protein
MFLVRPNPFNSSTCNPFVASTPHSGGIVVVMGDGSVRTCSPAMSYTTWWYACYPRDGLPMPPDWVG